MSHKAQRYNVIGLNLRWCYSDEMRLKREFFEREVLTVAPELLGKVLRRKFDFTPGVDRYGIITEVEAYRGEEDLASHARFGKTTRNRVMYQPGGMVYMYLVYGIHWMLNIVTGKVNQPQAILIRSLEGIWGPGKVTKYLQLDQDFYAEDLVRSVRLWIEAIHPGGGIVIRQTPRIGVNYAGEWAKKPWRFVMESQPIKSR